MDKLDRIKRKALILTSVSVAALAVGAVLGVLVFTSWHSASYGGIFWQLPVSVAFLYFAFFSLLCALDLRLAARVIPVINELGTRDVSKIAEKLGWREREAARFTAKLKKLKLISEE